MKGTNVQVGLCRHFFHQAELPEPRPTPAFQPAAHHRPEVGIDPRHGEELQTDPSLWLAVAAGHTALPHQFLAVNNRFILKNRPLWIGRDVFKDLFGGDLSSSTRDEKSSRS